MTEFLTLKERRAGFWVCRTPGIRKHPGAAPSLRSFPASKNKADRFPDPPRRWSRTHEAPRLAFLGSPRAQNVRSVAVRHVHVWRIRGASCTSFRWLRGLLEGRSAVVVHSNRISTGCASTTWETGKRGR